MLDSRKEAADLFIMTAKGDITVTQDIGLTIRLFEICEDSNRKFVEKCRKLDFFVE
jgi:hypothetical protein